jgi:excisionase family DNA binding protein
MTEPKAIVFPVDEAAPRLGMSSRHLRRLIAEGRIDVYRPTARRTLITEQTIHNYIEARTERATA